MNFNLKIKRLLMFVGYFLIRNLKTIIIYTLVISFTATLIYYTITTIISLQDKIEKSSDISVSINIFKEIMKISIPSLISTIAVLLTIINIRSTRKQYSVINNPILEIDIEKVKSRRNVRDCYLLIESFLYHTMLIENYEITASGDKEITQYKYLNLDETNILNILNIRLRNQNKNPYYNLELELKTDNHYILSEKVNSCSFYPKYNIDYEVKTKILEYNQKKQVKKNKGQRKFFLIENSETTQDNTFTYFNERKISKKINVNVSNKNEEVIIPLAFIGMSNAEPFFLKENITLKLNYKNKSGNIINEKCIIKLKDLTHSDCILKRLD